MYAYPCFIIQRTLFFQPPQPPGSKNSPPGGNIPSIDHEGNKWLQASVTSAVGGKGTGCRAPPAPTHGWRRPPVTGVVREDFRE